MNWRLEGLRKFVIRCDATTLKGECKGWPEIESGEKERVLILAMAFSQKIPSYLS